MAAVIEPEGLIEATLAGAGMVLVLACVARGFTSRGWKAVLGGLAGAASLGALEAGLEPAATAGAVSRSALGAALLLAGWLAWAGGVAGLRRWRSPPRLRGARPAAPPAGPLALRHLLGEVGIGVALLDVTIFVVASVALWRSLASAPLHHGPRLVAGAIVGAWIFFALGAPWALWGAWRATRADRGGGWPARWSARLLLVVLALPAGGVLVFEAPANLPVYAGLAFGAPEREAYALTLLRGGHEVHLRGRLGFGVTDDLRALLDTHRDVRVLQLNSIGGYLVEGFGVAGLAEERGLATYVDRSCASACVLAFAGGTERWIERGAALGLHGPSSPTGGPVWGAIRAQTEYLVGRGVDRAFVKRGLDVPPEELWVPTRAEVLAAGLATRRAVPDDVALPPLTPDELENFQLELRGDRLLEMLYEFERPLFDRFEAALRDGHLRGLTRADAAGGLQPELQGALQRHFATTSDRAAVRYFEALLRIARFLRARYPERCVALLDRGEIPHALFTDELTEAMADVVLEARNHPMGPPSRGAFLVALEGAEARMDEAQREALDEEGEGVADPAKSCAASVALFEAVIGQGEARAGSFLRYVIVHGDEEGDGDDESP